MSSDVVEDMTGEADAGQALVPRLRFAEFRDTGAWTRRPLSRYLREHKGRVSADTEIPVYSSSREGLTPQEAYFDGSNLQNFGEYSEVPNGFITYRHMSDDGVFKFNVNQTGGAIAVSKEYPVFTTSGISSAFLLKILNFSHDFTRFALSQKKGGTRTRLYLSALRAWAPLLPPDEAEQRKIADCLASLDAVIAAEEDRLSALHEYKKGLMQQLFPRPERIENGEKIAAETTPRLRFPEFRDAGEWEETSLATIGKLVSGLTYSPSDVRDSGLLVLRSANIQGGKIDLSDCVYVTASVKGANEVKPGDILICVRNGSTSLIGKNALIPDTMPLCTHGAFMTIFRTQAAKFVFQLFQTSVYQRQVAADLGATINSINSTRLLRYRFHIPGGPEQRRIGEFLAVIDERIASQSDKLKSLKAHKFGLMQQLFPSHIEVIA